MDNPMIICVPRHRWLCIMENQADGLAFEMVLNETAVKKQHFKTYHHALHILSFAGHASEDKRQSPKTKFLHPVIIRGFHVIFHAVCPSTVWLHVR
jgi:hypothetical protein